MPHHRYPLFMHAFSGMLHRKLTPSSLVHGRRSTSFPHALVTGANHQPLLHSLCGAHRYIHKTSSSSPRFVRGKLDLATYDGLRDPPVYGGTVPREAYSKRVQYKYYPCGFTPSPSVALPTAPKDGHISSSPSSSETCLPPPPTVTQEGCLPPLPRALESCATAEAQPYRHTSPGAEVHPAVADAPFTVRARPFDISDNTSSTSDRVEGPAEHRQGMDKGGSAEAISASPWRDELAQQRWDAIVIGAGHNGLISAATLAEKGLRVLVLERRHKVGGAAVTEELYPGFKYSRGSYLAGLMLPEVEQEMKLEQNGVEYLHRDPASYTPTLMQGPHQGKDLMLFQDTTRTQAQIAQFSARDAATWTKYEDWLAGTRDIVKPLLGRLPGGGESLWKQIGWGRKVGEAVAKRSGALLSYYPLLVGAAAPVLDTWFSNPVLKATLATDAVIGSAASIRAPGSAYVLLHHVMGQAGGREGAWAYVRGGMGAITQALAREGKTRGVEVVTGVRVSRIVCADGSGQRRGWADMGLNTIGGKEANMGKNTDSPTGTGKVSGVELDNGVFIPCDIVVSNATPYHTVMELLASDVDADRLHGPPAPLTDQEVSQEEVKEWKANREETNTRNSMENDGRVQRPPSSNAGPHHYLPPSFLRGVAAADRTCGAMKINMAVSRLPDFLCRRNKDTCDWDERGWWRPGPQHVGTVHFEESLEEFDLAHADYARGHPARKPIIEMTIPSSLDDTVAPPGQHVVQLFIQYVPYHLADDAWDTLVAPLHPTLPIEAPSNSAAASKLARLERSLPATGTGTGPGTAASWRDPAFTEAYVTRILAILDLYLDGFSSSVLHIDALTPLELERVFGLQEGCIFHEAMSLSQLALARPVAGWAHYRLPIEGLYVCGAGTHPGGGVMGAPGRNCAHTILQDLNLS